MTPPVVVTTVYVNQTVGGAQSASAQGVRNTQYLTWPAAKDDESGLKRYEIQWQKGTSLKWEVLESNTTQNYYKQSSLDPALRYRYRVRAENNAGSYTDWLVSSYTQVQKPKEVIYNVSFFPNPVKSQEQMKPYYELNQDANVTIKIYDALGHLCARLIVCLENGRHEFRTKSSNLGGTNIRRESSKGDTLSSSLRIKKGHRISSRLRQEFCANQFGFSRVYETDLTSDFQRKSSHSQTMRKISSLEAKSKYCDL